MGVLSAARSQHFRRGGLGIVSAKWSGMRHSILLAAFTSGLSALACGHNDEPAKGPAERAGESIDHAAAKTGKGVEKATEKTGNALGNAGDKVRKETKDEN